MFRCRSHSWPACCRASRWRGSAGRSATRMSIDQRFVIAIATMALIAYACRVAGLLVGTCLGDSDRLRHILDLLPACAIAAVLGPSLGSMTLVQGGALLVSVA